MKYLRLVAPLLLAVVLLSTTALAGQRVEVAPSISNAERIIINERNMGEQTVFVERNESGQLEFLVPHSSQMSDSEWIATTTWVANNSAKLEEVLSKASRDARWSRKHRSGDTIVHLNQRLHEWMLEAGAYSQINMMMTRERVSEVDNLEKSCPPVCTRCQKWLCEDFECYCPIWWGGRCCRIIPQQN